MNNYSSNPTPRSNSSGHKLVAAGAGLAILFFFLPWIKFSVWGYGESINGWQIASEFPMLFLVLLLAIFALVVAIRSFQNHALTKLDSVGMIASGAVALLILLISFGRVASAMGDVGGFLSGLISEVVSYQIGVWAVIIGHILVVIGGVINGRNA